MADLIDREAAFLVLRKAQIASCTCQIKTPDPDWHNHNCRYRILREIEAMIEHLPDAAAIAAPAEAGGVEGRPNAPCHIVEYTNWRGETARRVIIPISMWWGKTEWHPQEQWMLTAWDVEKEATRDFAWQDMKPVQNGATSAAVAAQRAATDPDAVEALVKAVEPDFCHDEEWEYTMRWDEWPDLVDSHDLTKPTPVYTLIKGPTKWVVRVPIDADGDDSEVRIFDSEDAALAAIREGRG